MKWVNVNDSLPSDSRVVLGTDGRAVYTTDRSGIIVGKTTKYWMPFPEPPRPKYTVGEYYQGKHFNFKVEYVSGDEMVGSVPGTTTTFVHWFLPSGAVMYANGDIEYKDLAL